MKIFTISLILFLFSSVVPAYATAGEHKNVFFVHHSTGEIYWNGTTMKGGMETYLSNHGYTGQAPWWNGNTDPQDFNDLFNDANSWTTFGDADIIIFKSCFPASAITSDTMLAQYKDYYNELYSVYESHPNVLFVPLSTPPLPKDMTDSAEAARAIAFDQWLTTDYLTNYSGANLAPFHLHRLLDNDAGFLKKIYVADPYDGHPKAKAGVTVGKAMWKHLNQKLGI
ncbi:MAG: hypothetical protein WCV88_04635 [Patescibacteria group bacterium]|jgi:hypothetical protein